MTESPNEIDEREAAIRIFRSIIRETEGKRINWTSRGSSRVDAYEADLASANIEVGTVDNDGVAPHDFRIFGPAPHFGLVYELDGRSESELQPELERLWTMVDRQVRGVDEVLKNLLRDLGEAPE